MKSTKNGVAMMLLKKAAEILREGSQEYVEHKFVKRFDKHDVDVYTVRVFPVGEGRYDRYDCGRVTIGSPHNWFHAKNVPGHSSLDRMVEALEYMANHGAELCIE